MKTQKTIKKILFITLSNIGDVFLSLPALDYLRSQFPCAKITVMTGIRPKDIFLNNPNIDKLVVYNKQLPLKEKINLFFELNSEKFDIVVDLRNTFLGFMLSARYKTSPFLRIPRDIRHMKDRHFYRIKSVKFPSAGGKMQNFTPEQKSLYISPEDEKYINDKLNAGGITTDDILIIVSPGARSHTKRWLEDKFLQLVNNLYKEIKCRIVLVGDKEDEVISKYIKKYSSPVTDLTGQTTILQLAALVKKSNIVITNDSAVLHIAGYLNIPAVVMFGPTSEAKYGAWSKKSIVVKKDIVCRPCEKAQCRFKTLTCMGLIKVNDVLDAVKKILIANYRLPVTGCQIFKRILIVRTDKIGDVILSTPVIKAMRDNCPDAYIAMMVSPYTREIVEGSPYLDKVIIYDKDGLHKGWGSSCRFIRDLKEYKFDAALILHPTNRVHLISYFAAIPRRIGYDRKLSFLLTDKIKHVKQLGQRHEMDYTLDLVRYLGIEPGDKKLFMPIKEESEEAARKILNSEGVALTDKILGIHPAASCLSKVWPAVRFSEAADKLVEKYGFKVLIFSGYKDLKLAETVACNMKQKAVNLAGKVTVSQLASLLKRCNLFISNDSGPVHIASAVGTPVISIFGRNQDGLSPKRWGPLGLKDRILHKQTGCIECLAHNCSKEFACLKAISVEDVLKIAEEILA
ncbi:MAG: lipopolysaccharide heptosyltransferase II [Candidatus Omnitrophota bacterium]